MGAWGYGIFQSDPDMDVIDQISEDIAKHTNDPRLNLWHPTSRKYLVAKLNGGTAEHLFKSYTTIKWDYGIFYLGAKMMQHGAKLTPDQRAKLVDVTKTLKQYPFTK